MLSFYIIFLTTFLNIHFCRSFVSYILRDEKYYNVDAKEIPDTFGRANSIAELACIIQSTYIGVIVDAFGRKTPIVVGQIVAGLSFFAMPLFSSTTAFVILRVLMNMGRSITMNIPLIADYCEKDSAGLAGAY